LGGIASLLEGGLGFVPRQRPVEHLAVDRRLGLYLSLAGRSDDVLVGQAHGTLEQTAV